MPKSKKKQLKLPFKSAPSDQDSQSSSEPDQKSEGNVQNRALPWLWTRVIDMQKY